MLLVYVVTAYQIDIKKKNKTCVTFEPQLWYMIATQYVVSQCRGKITFDMCPVKYKYS